ncbi:MAG: hypothetical protein UR12_C0049G0006 [candidate division TM6 bacterium GW2011_GWF2_30_66]|nr:MAG: hypothetical protein UR12_C0049G0006 [candidate division TM6 bacterium GW2011_GWF2_30_66]
MACENNNLDIVTLLLNKGADANIASDYGWTPLYWACYKNNLELVKLLLDYGAKESINKVDKLFGKTPLYWACGNDNLDIVTLLLASGADINKADEDGRTPLFLACENNNLEIVKLLLANGADIDQKSFFNAEDKPKILQLLTLVQNYDAEENKIEFIANEKDPNNYKMLVKRALVQSLNETRKETFKSIESTVFGKLYDRSKYSIEFVEAFGTRKQDNIYEFIRRAAENNHIYLEKGFIDKSIMALKSKGMFKNNNFANVEIKFTK